MADRIHRIALLVILPWVPATISPGTPAVMTQASPAPAELKIGGAVATPLVVTVADLKSMPRKTVRVTNPHEKKAEVYEGVPLEELLRKAGTSQGEQLRGNP
jgi:DMSO/TMAO reductase YedYZ molybdopterin-dependent catalytic subunit